MSADERVEDADLHGEPPDVHSSTDAYAARFAGGAGAYLLATQTETLRTLAASWAPGTMLDVGGGHAQVAEPFAAAGWSVTVLASTPSAYGRAARLAIPGVRLATGDLSAPPFPDRSFDVAVSMRMMAHVPDWRRLVAGLCRTARAAVIVDFPIPGGSNALEPLLFGMKRRLEGNTRRFTTIAKADVRAAFAEHGFTVDAMVGQFVMPMAMHRAMRIPAASRVLEGGLGAVGLARAIGTPVIARAVRNDAAGT